MTKTICDICGRDAKNKCDLPIFNDLRFYEDDLGYSYNADNYQIKKLDICNTCTKKLANNII